MYLEPGSALTLAARPDADVARPSRGGRAAGAGILAALTLLVALGLAVPALAMFGHVSIDYGEGWNAYWSQVAGTRPLSLYPAAEGLVSNNYPPAFFLLVGQLSRVGGDAIVIGRTVSLLALFATAVLAGACVWRMSRSRAAAGAAALLVLGYAAFVFNQFLAVNNPQWLGQAVTLAALMPLVGGAPSRRSYVLAALGITCAMLVKHNMVALPLAIAVRLALTDRRVCGHWVAGGALLCALVLVASYAVWGTSAFVQIFLFDRGLTFHGGLDGLIDVATTVPVVLVAALAARRWRGSPGFALLATYAGLATAIGLVQRFGIGVSDNAQFEGLCAAIVLACAGAGRLLRQRRLSGAAPHFSRAVLVMALPVVVAAPATLAQRWREWQSRDQAEAAFQAVIADVRGARGPVLCENLALCFWAGQPMALDFFAYGQKLRAGRDPGHLGKLLAARVPDRIVLDLGFPAGRDQARLPDDMVEAIRRGYRVQRVVPGRIAELVRRN